MRGFSLPLKRRAEIQNQGSTGPAKIHQVIRSNSRLIIMLIFHSWCWSTVWFHYLVDLFTVGDGVLLGFIILLICSQLVMEYCLVSLSCWFVYSWWWSTAWARPRISSRYTRSRCERMRLEPSVGTRWRDCASCIRWARFTGTSRPETSCWRRTGPSN